MSLIPWKSKREELPLAHLSPLGTMRSEFDRLFHSLMGSEPRWPEMAGWWSSAELPLDVEESDKQIKVRAEIPGVKAEDLHVSIEGGALVIAGEKKESQERKEQGYHYQERRFGSFRREVPLPVAVNADSVQAEYKDGVLSLTMDKSQEALPKRIPVKTG